MPPMDLIQHLKEAEEQTWSVRTLDRNISTQYDERLMLSQHKDLVENEMLEKTAIYSMMRTSKGPFSELSHDMWYTQPEISATYRGNREKKGLLSPLTFYLKRRIQTVMQQICSSR